MSVELPINVPWGNEPSFTQIAKMSVNQLLTCKCDEQYPDIMKYKGKHINRIEIVGTVINERNYNDIKYITIDDGSGLLDCLIMEKTYNMYMDEPFDSFNLVGNLVRLIGGISFVPFSHLYQTIDGDGDLCSAELFVDRIVLATDSNEEYLHWMEVINYENTTFST